MPCRVLRSVALPDGEPAWEAACDSHDEKVQLLADLAEQDARRPEVRRMMEIIASMPEPAGLSYPRLVQWWVQENIAFVPELRETFTDAVTMLRVRMGDCDDHARLVYALLRSIGARMKLATLGRPPIHVAAVIQLDDGRWRWLETTVPGARFGEHPVAAARRLGVRVRPELRG